MGNSYFLENTLQDLLDEIQYVYLSDKRPWVIGYSGGKDSTVVTHLVYTMLTTIYWFPSLTLRLLIKNGRLLLP